MRESKINQAKEVGRAQCGGMVCEEVLFCCGFTASHCSGTMIKHTYIMGRGDLISGQALGRIHHQARH
jgi:hypothetical protein